jgi:cobalt-zinc-cadmium efflux system outer membrane protein
MKKTVLLLCGLSWTALGLAEPLTMERALELARDHSAHLRAAQIQTRAAEASAQAAGKWSNPELEFEAEGIGGDLDMYGDGEYAVSLSQKFQRGGKRQKEKAVAFKAIAITEQTAQETERALNVELQTAFIELWAQQELGDVRSEQEQLGRASVEVANQRHEAGSSSKLDVAQAELALDEILLDQTCCFGDLAAAKEKLASLTGLPVDQLTNVSGPFYALPELDVLAISPRHPTLLRLQAQAEQLEAQAAQEKADDSADITLAAGYKHEALENIDTFTLSASIPLSIHKRGRAQQTAALLRADAVQAERMATHRQLQSKLAVLKATYQGAKAEAELIKNTLIPKADKAYQLSREGYEAGQYSWLELISAQQHLAAARLRYIEALRDAHLTLAQLAELIK